jgi:hypothetical protein
MALNIPRFSPEVTRPGSPFGDAAALLDIRAFDLTAAERQSPN